ncbi:energy-coupling factor ABC transporter ATP-binding protein [Desulfoscipio gibsoniae]|uniref:ABC-type cobalt transport system, ATPase component n=1 Tax=Desulfoscipio gibsoniae DSM 7213 TaxID=767817 RepID=R4KIA0_9FIRM|nr:ABC transporter ATP-binding protein [Desulfoscipio gibsoniae]AGL02928.1 ABC-type cobalt transport system, ATPase component [Desulfoscipio gibsoniae DSM 7213]
MKPILEIKGLSYRYEGGQRALRDIDLNIYPGEIVALVGQNGAGKTTLAKHIIGILKPPPDQVIVCGNDVAATPVSKMAKQVGFVFQNPDHQIFHQTVNQEVAFGLRNLGLPEDEMKQRVTTALKEVGLELLAGQYPLSLSRGQRQRLALACVLAMKPEVIVLDEPTTGQDQWEKIQIMNLVADLNKRGHTVIFITHDMSLVARYAKRVVVLCQGEIILDNSTQDALAKPEQLAKSFLKPPQITLLSNRLNETLNRPGATTVLTVEEMYSNLQAMMEGGA